MKLYSSCSNDATLNLAVEEILSLTAEEPVMMLWRNSPSIIVGRHQNTAAEINGEFVATNNIAVVRRITGGGAVYHDLGNVNFSFISMQREWGTESAARHTAPIVFALKKCGVDAEFSGRNDIMAESRKISGCARSVPLNHTLFHGTLLFDANLEILSQALNPDPDKFVSKGIKSVRARVGNVKDMLPPGSSIVSMDDFVAHLESAISEFFNDGKFQPVPTKILEKAQALADSKYRTWKWNYGTRFDYQCRNKTTFAGGRICAEFNIENNRIAKLNFSGDFFGARPIDTLTERLNGTIPKYDDVVKVLNGEPIQEYICGISIEELAKLLSIAE